MISTKGRYALRVMIDLAEQKSDDFVPLNEIAARQGISIKYLEIILKTLVKEKLLKGRRGKGGGYKLTRRPEDYSVGEILELTEGTLAVVACLQKDADPCDRRDRCRAIAMWSKFDKMTRDFFRGISLADIMRDVPPPQLLQIEPLSKKRTDP
ncbi:MAG: Rrf2 family transcriptional regulator [Thermoguttaceae bacterium]|nr:Rrf2 family transcriptional regulator [Thermoguttaceae bacterium]